MTIDLDHTSFAVDDALTWARTLRRELGATPIAGEALPEFRYLLLYVGDATAGARIELLDPTGPGFLDRFLAKHGPGPHHFTFTVPDLHETVARMRDLGATVVGEDYDHPSWREAFVLPDTVHGVVIQLAQSDVAYPSPAELLETRERDVDTFPSSRGASDRRWWEPVWNTEPERSARLGATRLASTDLDASRRFFGDGLGAHIEHADGHLLCSWPSGRVVVHQAPSAGVTGMDLTGGPPRGLTLGRALLGKPTHGGPS